MAARKPPPGEPEEPNPAIVPEPPERRPAEYEVVGPHAVYGHKPGSTFTALLPPLQEAQLVGAGHIAIVTEKERP